jgi:hypothetical protein
MKRSIRLCACSLAITTITAFCQPKPRARDLGVPFDGNPGPNNAITDVRGVEVGHTTLISGEGKLKVGEGPVRTGVTAVLPRGKTSTDAVFGGWFTLNGNGEMTGTTWLEDSGLLDGPVMITNTHSVGVVRDAVIAWKVKRGGPDMEGYWWSLPVVAETWDGFLNDINGFHVKPEHVFHALDTAHSGPVEEGSVGGGTGMICNEFKGGIGTSSRVLDAKYGGYTVGVLVVFEATRNTWAGSRERSLQRLSLRYRRPPVLLQIQRGGRVLDRDCRGRPHAQRPRLSRIYYRGQFYSYPLKPLEALWKLGLAESTLCVLSYIKARLFPIRNPKSFEDWVTNQFGARLFRIFFKTYTEKVWGMSCKEISADWAAQRIQGLSLAAAVKHALLPKRSRESPSWSRP